MTGSTDIDPISRHSRFWQVLIQGILDGDPHGLDHAIQAQSIDRGATEHQGVAQPPPPASGETSAAPKSVGAAQPIPSASAPTHSPQWMLNIAEALEAEVRKLDIALAHTGKLDRLEIMFLRLSLQSEALYLRRRADLA